MATSHNDTYERKLELVKAQSTEKNATKGAHVARFKDTIVTMFMEKIRSGKNYLAEGPDNGLRTWICVSENTDGYGIAVSCTDLGIRVSIHFFQTVGDPGVAVARSSGIGNSSLV